MKDINKIFEKNKIYSYPNTELLLQENAIEGNLDAELVVYYSTEGEEVLSETNRSFLYKMLGAVKHNKENTLFIADHCNINFKQIIQKGTAKRIMFFGSTRNDVGMNLNLKRYKIFNIQNIDCLFIDKISLIQEDQKRKSALWSLMKVMFSIS